MEQMARPREAVEPPRVPDRRRFYCPELDGLRFYAFLGVFLCHMFPLDNTFYQNEHLPFPGLWAAIVRAGGAGVDLFFVLSSFLITTLLLKEREETGAIRLQWFYLRRILRIWPLYFAVVALGVLFAHVPRDSSFWHGNVDLPWKLVLGYALFVANWLFGFIGPTSEICSPLWTVSVEEQFYFIWPAVIKVVSRKTVMVAGVVAYFAAIIGQLCFVALGARSSFVYYSSVSRCNALALGIVMALFVDSLPKLSGWQRRFLVVAGLVGLVVGSAQPSDFYGYASVSMVFDRVLISLGAAAIFYGCLHSKSGLIAGTRVVQLGKISYGLYMLHMVALILVLSMLRPARGWPLLGAKAFGLVVTVLLALASYRWLESPFLRLKGRFAAVPSRPV
jgi:peptidoglycan/LPS O-acetylase OafA/YrhL